MKVRGRESIGESVKNIIEYNKAIKADVTTANHDTNIEKSKNSL